MTADRRDQVAGRHPTTASETPPGGSTPLAWWANVYKVSLLLFAFVASGIWEDLTTGFRSIEHLAKNVDKQAVLFVHEKILAVVSGNGEEILGGALGEIAGADRKPGVYGSLVQAVAQCTL